MELVYKVKDRPPFVKMLIFALQQLLAILAATIAVPAIIGNGMSQSAALFGAAVRHSHHQIQVPCLPRLVVCVLGLDGRGVCGRCFRFRGLPRALARRSVCGACLRGYFRRY